MRVQDASAPSQNRLALAAAGLVGCACSLLAPGNDHFLGGVRTDASPAGDSGGLRPPWFDASREATAGNRRDAGGSMGIADARRDAPPGPKSDASCTDAAHCGDAAITCADAGDCPADRYCSSKGTCTRCDDLGSVDFTTVEFGESEPLIVLNASATDELLRYPRAFDDGSKLVYVRDFLGATGIWLTDDFLQHPGAKMDASINDVGRESRPLKVAGATGVLAGYNFFFDRGFPNDGGVVDPRILYGVHLDAAGRPSAPATRLPVPFNDPPRIGLSLAVSSDRAFWTARVNAGLDIELYGAPLQGDPTTIIPSQLMLKLPSGCLIVEFDYSAWAAPDGSFLLIDFTERTDDCTPSQALLSDIGIVALDRGGQPKGPVVPLNVSRPLIADTDASLSPDMCWLYFSSSRTENGRLRLYRARRLR